MKTKAMTITALITAVLCIMGPLAIVVPISPVPISLATLAIYFAVYVLGAKGGMFSCLLYLLMGTIGLPIFSGFSGGIGKLMGPTGGYLTGYLALAFIAGAFIEKWQGNRYLQAVGMILGTAVCYMSGTCWLAWQSDISFGAALGLGVLPFIPGDIIKLAIAVTTGPVLRKRLIQAGLVLFPKNMDK